MTSRKHTQTILNVLLYAFLLMIAMLYLLPLLSSILEAFRTNSDLLKNGFLSAPHPWYFGGFGTVWQEGNLKFYMVNSAVVTGFAVLGTLVCASLAGYATAKYRFSLKVWILLLFLAGLFFPPQIYVIPIYHLANKLGIYNNYWGLILVHIAYQLPFATLFLQSFFRTIPSALLDAARIDGAGEMRILIAIVLPLSIPALGAMTILLFTWIWNDYFWALAMSHSIKAQTIMVGIAQFHGRLTLNWNQEASSSLIAMLPPLLTFIAFQRLFIKGVRMGGVK